MKKIVAITALILLVACSKTHTTQMKSGPIATAAIGALVGGITAGQFGSGAGQLIFTILGGALGAGVGYSIGEQLVPSDLSRFRDSAKYAMDDTRDGELYNWTNPSTGVAGTIKPTRTYYAGENIYCRDFEAKIAVNQDIGEASSRACRVAGGPWYLEPNV